MQPSIPELTQTWPSIPLKLLQLLILSISLALLYYTEAFFRCGGGYVQGTAFMVLVSQAIPLLWILPIYLVISLVRPILLYRRPQSTYGRRPTWLSPKERCFAILFPALVSLGVAAYLMTPTGWMKYAPENMYQRNCDQRSRSPLTLILSVLVLMESYITYRLDSTQLDVHQPVPAKCGKHLCLHKCVSAITNSNLSATPPLSSTYCTSVRLIRNTRIIALVIGIFYMAFIIMTGIVVKIDGGWWGAYLAYIFSLLLWFLIIISIFRPTVTRPAQDLHPTLRLALSLIPVLAVLVYHGFFQESGDKDIALYVFKLLGIVFHLLMIVELVMTFLFDQRRYNTARKVDIWMMQQQKFELPSQQLNVSGAEFAIELGNKDSRFQEPAWVEGKIEVHSI